MYLQDFDSIHISKRYFVVHCLRVQYTCLYLLFIMHIKFCYKMANNDDSMTFCVNTIHENERMLHEFCRKHQTETKSKKDFEELFIKLNYICQLKSTKEEVQLNTSWCNKNVISYIYGPILEFPSGSWWGIRMDCSRDRVHDPFDKNIQDGPFGVTSICTSSTNLNEDVDFGDSLTLTGQKYIDKDSDKDPLIKNYENLIPVRLIRSYNLLNEFAPKTGYRYDGLYIVTNFWIGINLDSTKYYKFALFRLTDQEPPIWNINQSCPNVSKVPSILHPVTISFQNYSENQGPGPIVQKGKYDIFENKQVDEKEKGISESGIVTRHVFKKTNTECTSNMLNVFSASENKSFTLIGTQGSKAHNTNISIRTGLYDSSHSTQHDIKKNTLSPFCRTIKSLNLTKSNQNAESLNALNKDKSRSLEGKSQIVTANEFPKRVDYISLNTVKPDVLRLKSIKDINLETNCNTDDINLSSSYKYECNNSKTYRNVIKYSKDMCESNINLSDTSTSVVNSTDSIYRNEVQKIVSKDIQELKSLDSLDTLTPDTILQLINKKYHPLSKLLMGNMIGLTSEQSITLKPHDLLTIQSEVNNKVITQKSTAGETKEKQKIESISDDVIGTRCYKFRRRRKLSRKIMNKSEVRKCDKMHNGELQKDSIESLNILGQNLMALDTSNDSQKNMLEEGIFNSDKSKTSVKTKIIKQNNLQKKKLNCMRQSSANIKRDVGSKSEIRTRLRTMETINSSLKKHINKKQRREIANLLIDAKIGPKIRGPRNRRLRCISNTYTKQPHERFNTAICTLNKCQINMKIPGQRSTFKNRNKLTKISNYKSIRDKQTRDRRSNALDLNETRTHKNLTTSKKIVKNDIAGKMLSNNNNKSDNNKKSNFVNTNIKNVQSTDKIVIRNRKRKLIQTIPREAKCSEINELYENCTKESSKPCKADAITQCSLIKEPLVKSFKSKHFIQDNSRSEQYTFIKIKYGEYKDTKSKMYGVTRSNSERKNLQLHQSDKKYNHCHIKTVCNIPYPKNSSILFSRNIVSTKEQNKSSVERVSAFVPVNILDSELKIARLRSIGFKPIVNSDNSNEDISDQNRGNSSATLTSKVLKQNVAEKYDKYTNEENDVVVYMDDELQYQDIEDEDNNSVVTKHKMSELEFHVSSNEQIDKITVGRSSTNDLLLEQDLELPWHGWKKVVTSEDTYWIGW